MPRVAALDLLEQLHHPARPLAAGRALAAGLVHVELRRAQRELHHAAALVDHDQRGGAEERPDRAQRVVVERHVDLPRGQRRHRGAARDDRLQLVAAGDPARVRVDQLAHRGAELELVVAGLLDVAGDREEHRARRARRADLVEPVGAELEDRRHGRDRADVVDLGRRHVEALHRRERRPRPRLAAPALERVEQRRLLAADVGAGAAVDGHVHLAEEARLARLVDGRLQDLVLGQVLAADVDEDVLRLDRVRGDQAALEQPVRHARHHLAVLERARLGLVGVDDQVLRLRALAVDQRGLAAHREAGAAAAAQVRLLQLGDQLVRAHLQRLRHLLVAADRLVLGELRQVALVRAGEQHRPKPHGAPSRSRARRPA